MGNTKQTGVLSTANREGTFGVALDADAKVAHYDWNGTLVTSHAYGALATEVCPLAAVSSFYLAHGLDPVCCWSQKLPNARRISWVIAPGTPASAANAGHFATAARTSATMSLHTPSSS